MLTYMYLSRKMTNFLACRGQKYATILFIHFASKLKVGGGGVAKPTKKSLPQLLRSVLCLF